MSNRTNQRRGKKNMHQSSPSSIIVHNGGNHGRRIGRKYIKMRSRSRRSLRNAPKLWRRQNGRLCRCDVVDQLENSFKRTPRARFIDNISSQQDKPWRISILDLPEECLIFVLRNLPFAEICNVARVCKRFYQVSCNPTLWKSIDLSSVYALRLPSTVNLVYPSHMMTFPKRRLLFASFLYSRRAALTDIRGEANLFSEDGMFHRLLNCNTNNLHTVRLQMPRGVNFLTYAPTARELQGFRDVLRHLVHNCSNALKCLKCYADISYATAEMLGSFHHLEYLNLHFLTPSPRSEIDVYYLQPEAMNGIMSLPRLKYLKISICQSIVPKANFAGYILKSNSLETLHFGFTKEFIIRQMILPKLHTIKAECLRNFHGSQKAVCLLDVIERGCPRIQTLNHYTSLVPGLQNFNLSHDQKRSLHFCICPIHDPSRAYH